MERVPRSFGTHDGSFHADEVTACALLLMFDRIDSNKILRSRDLSLLARCDYICDVGGVYDPEKRLFDHHQADYKGDLSSAGMILLYLCDTGSITQSEYDFLNRAIILGVDAHDNGKDPQIPGYCTYSHLIAAFNPHGTDDSDATVMDRLFFDALHFARESLDRLWQRYQYMQSCRYLVEQAMQKPGPCLLFDRNIPWMEMFFELNGEQHPALFVIMPTGQQHWKLRGVPPSYQERMLVRQPLPEKWAGLLDDDLKKVTGIPGALFCHKGRFISVWETKGDALLALSYILEEKK